MRILLRAWPKGGGQGLERGVTRKECTARDGELFYISELEYSLLIHRRIDEAPEGYDLELRFEVSVREHETLRLSWERLSKEFDCPHCIHQKT